MGIVAAASLVLDLMMKHAFPWLLSILLALPLCGANWPERPELRAVRVQTSPAIDGDLSDAAWQGVPEFTDFTQHEPNDGQPASMRTSLRIIYDDQAIYFGVEMEDDAEPTSLLARRDTYVQSDFLSINIDPQLDRLSGNAFTITPANVQIDTVLYNDIGEDSSWDGVWDSATRVTPRGWSAEVRIPFSQLRFPDKPVHVWGLNVTRRTVRTNEWVRVVNTPKGQTGFVSNFANIVGIEGIRRGRPLEIIPYGVARSDLRSGVGDHPLLESSDYRLDGGLDVKYALTSSLTLTGTINPDFGQVEVDPAIVNLSEFETFFPERRPFFTEGLGIFRFGDSPAPSKFNFLFPPSMFYTRRIGRAPQVRPDATFADVPSETTILGAAKITGRLPGGWSLGILDALTDSEHARFVGSGGIERQQVEPMTNYFVARATKELGVRSRIGTLFTAVHRNLNDDLSMLRESAITGGLDAYTSFRDKSWVLEGAAVASSVSGSAESIALTQASPARYYQRPDAKHVRFDPSRTSLSGWGGRTTLTKATGVWRPSVQVQAYSPGFETNDAGFMQRTDLIAGHALMIYRNQVPTQRVREKTAWFGYWNNRNFDGDTLEQGLAFNGSLTSANYWSYGTALYAFTDAMSDRLTRGGPVARVPGGFNSEVWVESDSRRALWFAASANLDELDDGSNTRRVGLSLNARPASNLRLSAGPSFSRSFTRTQFVRSFDDPSATATYGRRYLFSNLHQRSFELSTRVDWTLSARLSFQLYLQPFLASGEYEDYHSLAAARTRDYVPHPAPAQEPDFNFRSVRGSAVVRWELRPGSALYVVWNENRADVAPFGDFRLGRDLRAIPDAPSHDVILVKLSYWLPL